MSTLESAASRRERFDLDGYLLPVPILAPEEVRHYRGVFERLQAEHQASGRGGRMSNRHHDSAEIFRLATHPAVLGVARDCFGPDLVLISTGFFYKAPLAAGRGDPSGTAGGFVDWHQDTMYWGLRPPKALTVWIALYESDVENGCMRLVPRTHRVGLLPHGTSHRPGNLLNQNQAIDPRHFDEATAVDCVLAPGEASVHHGELVHGSNANRSDRPRCGMTARFTTPDVRPVTTGEHAFRDRPMLVAGEDRFGHFTYAPKPRG